MQDNHPYARRLAQDLFDAFWLEDLFGFRKHCTFHSGSNGEAMLEIALDDTRLLRWHGRAATGLRPFRISRSCAILHQPTHALDLELVNVATVLQSADWWHDDSGRFAHLFELAHRQTARAAKSEDAVVAQVKAAPDDLLSWEALTALKGRPFHPLALAKDGGKNNGDLDAYAPETLLPFSLHWVALPRDRVRCSVARAKQPLARTLLDCTELAELSATARHRGADSHRNLWLPVHPWQWAWLQRTTPSTIAACVDLGSGPGKVRPTASIRSLAAIADPNTHLKLSLAVNLLGADRSLPPRYLHNGTLAGICIEDLRQRDTWLASHLLPCEESQWWALRQSDVLEDDPGELACLVRRYPTLPGATLIPMAALAVTTSNGSLPAFDYLLNDDEQEACAWRLFADTTGALLELGLRCYAQGVMPELHGQNVLLAFRERRIVSLILRDHDTLRICRPFMSHQGIAAPHYVFDRSVPNTLELDTPCALLAYLQTLAIEVNLYAVLAALAERYGRDEQYGWQIIRTQLIAVLARVPFPNQSAHHVRRLLLEESSWPFKQLLAPLLARPVLGTGMPSAMGRLSNPLWDTPSPSR